MVTFPHPKHGQVGSITYQELQEAFPFLDGDDYTILVLRNASPEVGWIFCSSDKLLRPFRPSEAAISMRSYDWHPKYRDENFILALADVETGCTVYKIEQTDSTASDGLW